MKANILDAVSHCFCSFNIVIGFFSEKKAFNQDVERFNSRLLEPFNSNLQAHFGMKW